MRIASVIFLTLLLATWPAKAGDKPCPKVGDPAPPVVLKLLDGSNTFYLRDYCGQPRTPRTRQERDVVVFSFFTTWCVNCKKEIPCLQEMASKYTQDSVRFYLINVGESKDSVETHVFNEVISLPVLHDEFSQTAKRYQANSLPTLVVVDKEGKIAEYHTGFVPGYEKELENTLNLLLGKTKPGTMVSTAKPDSAKPDSAKAKPKTNVKKAKTKNI
jgi:thiol-disulfide isomerase/thioredoxin